MKKKVIKPKKITTEAETRWTLEPPVPGARSAGTIRDMDGKYIAVYRVPESKEKDDASTDKSE